MSPRIYLIESIYIQYITQTNNAHILDANEGYTKVAVKCEY